MKFKHTAGDLFGGKYRVIPNSRWIRFGWQRREMTSEAAERFIEKYAKILKKRKAALPAASGALTFYAITLSEKNAIRRAIIERAKS